jgi:hypothetical protein
MMPLTADEETGADAEEIRGESNIVPFHLRKISHKPEDLEALASRIIESNKVPYHQIGFAPAFSREMIVAEVDMRKDRLGVRFYTDVSEHPDCGNIALKCVGTAFEQCENPGSLTVLRVAKRTDFSVQNFIILVPRDNNLVKYIKSYKGKTLTEDESREIGDLLAKAGAVQVDATPWYERTTSHHISRIHEVINTENMIDAIKRENHLKKDIFLDRTSIITTLDKHDDLWIEGYIGVLEIALTDDHDLSFTPQIYVRACRTVVDKDEMRLMLDAYIPNQKRLKKAISECPETDSEKIFEYLRANGVLIPRVVVLKKDPERTARIARAHASSFTNWGHYESSIDTDVQAPNTSGLQLLTDIIHQGKYKFTDNEVSESESVKSSELFEEAHNYSYLDFFAEQGELEAALVRNLKRNYCALIGAIRALPAEISSVENHAKSILLLNQMKNPLGSQVNVDDRVMGDNINEEFFKTLDKFPEALTSEKGTLLWEYTPKRFPFTELVESYSLVRSVTYKSHGVDIYGVQLMVTINDTEENKLSLGKYKANIEGLSSEYVRISVYDFGSPCIMIHAPSRAVGENTGVDVAAVIAKFMKVEEKLSEICYNSNERG